MRMGRSVQPAKLGECVCCSLLLPVMGVNVVDGVDAVDEVDGVDDSG